MLTVAVDPGMCAHHYPVEDEIQSTIGTDDGNPCSPHRCPREAGSLRVHPAPDDMNEEVLRLAHEHGLERVSERIEHLLRPGIHISKAEASDLPTGCSRFGGLPDVPAGFAWPHWRDRPMGFLAQIRCEDLATCDSTRLLPVSGVLYFFYDFDEQPWGFDPKHRGGAVVHYAEHSTPLSRAGLPGGAKLEAVSLAPFRLGFSAVPSLPSSGSEAFQQLALHDEEWDRYHEFYDAVRKRFTDGEPCHQILGHSNNVQGDMQLECQLVSHGLYCGDCTAYESPQRAELEPGAAEWRLLLQFDSDDDLNVMWGDCGMIYFWIRESDLQAKRFSKSWTILQCS